MVHRISRDGEVAYLEGFSWFELVLPLPPDPGLLGEFQPDIHHVASAWTEIDGDFSSRERQ